MTAPGTTALCRAVPELGSGRHTAALRQPAGLARLVQHPREALRKTSDYRR